MRRSPELFSPKSEEWPYADVLEPKWEEAFKTIEEIYAEIHKLEEQVSRLKEELRSGKLDREKEKEVDYLLDSKRYALGILWHRRDVKEKQRLPKEKVESLVQMRYELVKAVSQHHKTKEDFKNSIAEAKKEAGSFNFRRSYQEKQRILEEIKEIEERQTANEAAELSRIEELKQKIKSEEDANSSLLQSRF